MSKKLLLLIFGLCAAFKLKCPDPAHWSTRAKFMCPEPSKYSCLLDGNALVYIEDCTKVDFEPQGKKITILDNFYSKCCVNSRYYPFKYWTSLNSDCISMTSKCTEEGQVMYNAGPDHDAICSCDYNGYDFVTRPNNLRFCIPSQEDCSCYKKNFPFSNPKLSSDYTCSQETQKQPTTDCRPTDISIDGTKKSTYLKPIEQAERNFERKSDNKLTTPKIPSPSNATINNRQENGSWKKIACIPLMVTVCCLICISLSIICCGLRIDIKLDKYFCKVYFISKLPAEITGIEGGDVTLRCIVSKPNTKVKWTKRNEASNDEEEISSSCNYTIQNTTEVHSLHIKNLELKHSARYTIGVNGVKCYSVIKVQEYFTNGLKENFECTEGENVQLSCEVIEENLTASWKMDGTVLKESDRYEIKSSGIHHTLTIRNTAMGDAGKYSVELDCRERSTTLQVNGYFQNSLKEHYECTEGDVVHLSCAVIGENGEACWKKNSHVLKESEKYEIKSSGKHHTLTIRKAAMADAGKYSVEVDGRKRSSILQVKEYFTNTLKENSECIEGENMHLSCAVIAESLTAYWKKDCTILRESEKYEIKSSRKHHTLTIRKATMDDAGKYSVDVDGRERSTILQVKEKSNHGLRKYYEKIILKVDLNRSVLDHLISICAMTTEDRIEVNREPTTTGRNRIILDILIERPYETSHLLKEALQMGDQHCIELMKDLDFTTKITDECDDRFSKISVAEYDIGNHTVKLHKNYKKIVEQVGAIEMVCDSLVSEHVFNIDDVKDINAEKNDSDRNRCLLSKLIGGSSSGYASFVQALREDRTLCELAVDIEKTPVNEHDVQRLKIGQLKLKERQEYRIIKEKEWFDRLKAIEHQMAATIPNHRLEQIRICLDEWRKENDTFVTTSATNRVLKLIRENNCVTVTGNSGMGKTAAVRYAAMVLLQEGYIVVPVSIPGDIVSFCDPKRKILFVIDDLCGRYTLSQRYLEDWKLRVDEIEKLLKNGNCKVIATCRLQVFKDERFKNLSIFSTCECNLCSEELRLSGEEKSRFINAYCGVHPSDVGDTFNIDFFPLLCRLYKKNKHIDIYNFFNNPFQRFDEEIEKLIIEDDTGKYKYCCLVLVVIFNNRLNEEILSGEIDSKNTKIIKQTLSKCRLNKGTSPECLLDSLKTLVGTFLVYEEGCYRTYHDKLFDYLSHFFGNKMIHILIDYTDSEFIRERFIWKTSGQTTVTDFTINIPDKYIDKYVERMINDWSEGKVVGVFNNRNIKSKEFSAKLLDRLNQLDTSKQSQLAQMRSDSNYDDTPLTHSCVVGDVNFTRWIIDHGASVNQCRKDGVSPLYIACQNGNIDTVLELIKCGSDLHKCDKYGESPLYAACRNGNIETVIELIKCGSDLHNCDNVGKSPFFAACENGNIDTVRELIKCGSDLHRCNADGRSPLYIACRYGKVDTVIELIKCGSDIHKCDDGGRSPLYAACFSGNINTVRELIKCGCDLHKCDNNGESPLYAACYYGNIDTVRELIKCGSDLHKCDNEGKSPFYAACENGNTDTVRELIKCGSDLHKCDNDGKSPLYAACRSWSYNNIDTVRELIKCGSDLHKCTNDGKSPLYAACYNGNIDTVRVLIKCGSDLHRCDNTNTSPLYVACQNEHLNVVILLMEYSNQDSVNTSMHVGGSPLLVATCTNNKDIVKKLLDSNADVNKCVNNKDKFCEAVIKYHNMSVDSYMEVWRNFIKEQASTKVNNYIQESLGNQVLDLIVSSSPLHVACFMGHIDSVKLILEKNPNINITKEDGTTPLFLACEFGHADIVKLMIERGAIDKICRNDGKSPLDIASENGHGDVVSLLTGHWKESM